MGTIEPVDRPDVDIKVNIPPRRRSATLGVSLGDTREAKAVVNVKSIRLTVSWRAGRYTNSEAVTIPRDLDALENLGALIEAVRNEVIEQTRWAEQDAAERAAIDE